MNRARKPGLARGPSQRSSSATSRWSADRSNVHCLSEYFRAIEPCQTAPSASAADNGDRPLQRRKFDVGFGQAHRLVDVRGTQREAEKIHRAEPRRPQATPRVAPRILTARPPAAVQPEFTGCASASERASQSCTRGVAPSMDKFQSGGQRNTPSARGRREPRNHERILRLAAGAGFVARPLRERRGGKGNLLPAQNRVLRAIRSRSLRRSAAARAAISPSAFRRRWQWLPAEAGSAIRQALHPRRARLRAQILRDIRLQGSIPGKDIAERERRGLDVQLRTETRAPNPNRPLPAGATPAFPRAAFEFPRVRSPELPVQLHGKIRRGIRVALGKPPAMNSGQSRHAGNGPLRSAGIRVARRSRFPGERRAHRDPRQAGRAFRNRLCRTSRNASARDAARQVRLSSAG